MWWYLRVYCLLFCEKSPKTLPFLLPFFEERSDWRKISRKKRTFFSPRRLRIPRGIHRRRRRRKREKTTRERRPLLLRKWSGWRARTDRDVDLGLVLLREDILVFECSYFLHFSSSDKKISHENREPYSSNLIYSYSHQHFTTSSIGSKEEHALYT